MAGSSCQGQVHGRKEERKLKGLKSAEEASALRYNHLRGRMALQQMDFVSLRMSRNKLRFGERKRKRTCAWDLLWRENQVSGPFRLAWLGVSVLGLW